MAKAHHELMDGRLHVYMRGGSRYWQCSTFLNNRNWRTSTKTDSIAHAMDFAEDWYLTLRGKQKAGVLKHERTFAHAADQFKEEYEALTEGERNATYVAGHWRRLNLHLLPFFGKLGLSEVTPAKVQAYRIHRRKEVVKGKNAPPARSTIHQEMVTLRQVLNAAVMQGWLPFVPSLKERYKKSGKIVHRAWFSPEEYKQLYTATRARTETAKRKNHKESAEDLHDLVLFMANTGLRPDEVRRIEFRDVKIVKDRATKQTILEIDVRGKRGVGFCKSMNGAVHPFERVINRRTLQGAAAATDLVFPKMHNELLNIILDEQKLKFDREGQRRTAYSLRHTYICLRLMEGADIYQIAKNCRTSVKMIEEFYASHIKDLLDTASINVRRPRSHRTRVHEAHSGEVSG
jgi:integrase